MEQIIKMDNLKRSDREFRSFKEFEIRNEQDDMIVEGYAVTFNEPTVMYSYDGIDYKEQIDDRAFEGTDMKDVIFNYNHGGKVIARTRNKTLELRLDKKGLYIKAKLDGTDEGRKIYEEIKGGYIDKMSFAFTVSESAYDSENHTRTIRKIKKLYDVSAVDIPAYDTTSISARSFFELEREKEQKALDKAQLRRKLILKTYF